MLRLDGISASYGSVPAIGNVSIEIGEGEAVGPDVLLIDHHAGFAGFVSAAGALALGNRIADPGMCLGRREAEQVVGHRLD